MGTIQGNPFSGFFKRILQIGRSGNNGVALATYNVQSGDGVATSISLAHDVLQVQPQSNNTTGAMTVKNLGGDTILAVDTLNTKVLVGASQVAAYTQ